MSDRLQPVVTVSSRRRRRRRRPSLLIFLGILGLGAAIAWLWFSIFAPLFEDPDDWVSRHSKYRKILREVVVGQQEGGLVVPDLPPWPPKMVDAQVKVLACAEKQVIRGVRLRKGYHLISYPWGDLPAHFGTSPDLVIRCLRELGLDLQQLVNMDRVRHPKRYPLHIWRLKRPDTSIDHRRLPILYTFIRHFSKALSVLSDSVSKRARFVPGDLVFWVAQGGGNYPGFVGIITDRRTAKGMPYVITMAPNELTVSDRHLLTDWQVMGHFRIDPDTLLERFLDENPGARLQPR
jgi:uncharacterized protein YijF (DUF1287 family)